MTTFLCRDKLVENEEMDAIRSNFKATNCIVPIQNELVVCRFSAVPHFNEVERALVAQGSRSINNLRQHNYIKNFDYYWDVEEYTPKTWFRLSDVPSNEAPFVLKGTTTSKKSSWNRSMYAEKLEDATRIYLELSNDYFIGEQSVIIRKYQKDLIKLGEGINGMPFLNEHRFFFYKDIMLSNAFYWSISETIGAVSDVGLKFAQHIANIISQKCNYFVLDIAEKTNGEYCLIEINLGEMSGLELNDPYKLYGNLAMVLKEEGEVCA